MRATTLAALDAEAQRDAFNRVYEGYLLPLRLTTSQVAQHFALNDIAREHSPVWLDDAGAVVALAALGLHDRRGWVGGFGVAPAARGRGLGTLLIATVIETALKLGLRRVQLEVLVGNEIARRLYEQARFVHRRRLDTFERPVSAPPPLASVADEMDEIDPLAALAWVDAHRVEPAAWQREPARLARLPDLQALAVGPSAAPRAVAVYIAGAAVSLLDLVGPPTALAVLLATLATRFPDSRLRVGNEASSSPLAAALVASGWREVIRQYEMVIELAPGLDSAAPPA